LQFYLFKRGKQVAHIRSVNPPGLLATIDKQLAAESGTGPMRQSSDEEAQ
jgi:hypothetical protein